MAHFIVISSKTMKFVTDFASFALFVFAKKEKNWNFLLYQELSAQTCDWLFKTGAKNGGCGVPEFF